MSYYDIQARVCFKQKSNTRQHCRQVSHKMNGDLSKTANFEILMDLSNTFRYCNKMKIPKGRETTIIYVQI